MEIKIGVQNLAREVVVEIDESPEDLKEQFRAALADNAVLELTDTKGNQVVIAAGAVAYIEIGTPNARPVGFGTI